MTGILREVSEHMLNIHPRTFSVRQKKRVLAKEKNESINKEVAKLYKGKQGLLKGQLPFPEIDQKIESLDSFKFKYFLDAYKEYHKIRMAEEDEEITAFPIEHGTFCYEKMTFGLKNTGATSQRSVYQAFIKQLGSNIEIYVDDMVIKSKSEGSMIADIEETFATLRRMNMKLNLKKYIFGVETSQFLGHMITKEGIKANPDKVKAIVTWLH
ncbi:reverse transcriptase domain-containing protein [Tanacetum coccineum]